MRHAELFGNVSTVKVAADERNDKYNIDSPFVIGMQHYVETCSEQRWTFEPVPQFPTNERRSLMQEYYKRIKNAD